MRRSTALTRFTARSIRALGLVAALVACDASQTLSPQVVESIEAQGFEIRLGDPPVGIVAPGGALTAAQDRGNQPAGPFYVVVTCPGERECRSWSGWMPRQPAAAWVVTFPGQARADGGPSEPWSLWQAETGDFVTGFSPRDAGPDPGADPSASHP